MRETAKNNVISCASSTSTTSSTSSYQRQSSNNCNKINNNCSSSSNSSSNSWNGINLNSDKDNTSVVVVNSMEGDNNSSNDNGGAFLFGRSWESTVLLDAYERVRQLGTKQTVVVHGASGTGKTALVSTTLQEHLCHAPTPNNGIAADTSNPHSRTHYFCRGKFVQNQCGRKPCKTRYCN